VVTIPSQFNGPPTSGNGGWVSGLIAQATATHQTPGPITVRLASPPPLDVPLSWERHGDQTRLVTHGGAIIGTGMSGSFAAVPPPALSAEQVQSGHDHYAGFTHHPFDLCFTCGTGRGEGDGLRIFSGPVPGTEFTAAPWYAHAAFADADGHIAMPVTWAALDCPGGWAANFNAQPMVLGTMTAEVFHNPTASETYKAIGLLRRREGRKFETATALYDEADQLIGRAEQVWIQIDLEKFS
jgi:hypothetical protein